MKQFNESMLEEFFDWEISGVNVGDAVRKQILPDYLPEVKIEEVDDTGKTVIYTKPKCPRCGEISYSGKYCQHCGRRLR